MPPLGRLLCLAVALLASPACSCGEAVTPGGDPADAEVDPADAAAALDTGVDAAPPRTSLPGMPAPEATGRTPEGEDPDGDPVTPPATSIGAAGDRVDVGEADAVFEAPDSAVSGRDVLLVGDMDGDGRSEMAIGSAQYRRHSVYLLYGRASHGDEPLLGAPDATLELPVDMHRMTLAAPGDVDGDGLADMLVGIAEGGGCLDELPKGRVYIVYGRSERLRGTTPIDEVSVKMLGERPCDGSGRGLAGGDLDGDHIADLALGGAAHTPVSYPSAVHVFYGSRRAFDPAPIASAPATVFPPEPPSPFGGFVAHLGDVDGDSYGDLLVKDGGNSWVLYGAKDRLAGEHRITYLRSTRLDGAPGCPAGDVDHDGVDDVVVRAGHVVFGYYRGAIGGLADDVEPTAMLRIESEAETAEATCGLAGDLDGDGDTELFIADAAYDDRRGIVYIVPGGTILEGELDLARVSIALVGRTHRAEDGVEYPDALGFSVSGGEDVNGDGYDDLLLGAPDPRVLWTPGPRSPAVHGGRVYLWLGGP